MCHGCQPVSDHCLWAACVKRCYVVSGWSETPQRVHLVPLLPAQPQHGYRTNPTNQPPSSPLTHLEQRDDDGEGAHEGSGEEQCGGEHHCALL